MPFFPHSPYTRFFNLYNVILPQPGMEFQNIKLKTLFKTLSTNHTITSHILTMHLGLNHTMTSHILTIHLGLNHTMTSHILTIHLGLNHTMTSHILTMQLGLNHTMTSHFSTMHLGLCRSTAREKEPGFSFFKPVRHIQTTFRSQRNHSMVPSAIPCEFFVRSKCYTFLETTMS